MEVMAETVTMAVMAVMATVETAPKIIFFLINILR
jgi:hypothetical protein